MIGQYAMAYHLPDAQGNLTEIVKAWKSYRPDTIPLPHPSPQNHIWLKKNEWFEDENTPYLQGPIKAILKPKC